MDPLPLLGSMSGIAGSVVLVCARLIPPRPEKPSLALFALSPSCASLLVKNRPRHIRPVTGPSCFRLTLECLCKYLEELETWDCFYSRVIVPGLLEQEGD